VAEISGNFATVELGQGIRAVCRAGTTSRNANSGDQQSRGTADLQSLSSMLAAKWKSGSVTQAATSDLAAGQIRSFKVIQLDPGTKKIEVEIA